MQIKYMPYRSDFLSDINQMNCIAIIVAMEVEELALTDGENFKDQIIGNRTKCSVKELKLRGRQILVSQSGVGLVNAGIRLTLLLEHYPVDSIILLGVGGALGENLKIGDTVIANQVVQHDSLSSHDDNHLLIAPGELTISASPDKQVNPVMRCDTVLTKWLYNVFEKASENERIVEGTVLSGSEFVASSKRKLEIRRTDKDALLVEMEASALCQIARRMNIPIGIAKTVVDRLNPDNSVSDDYKTFMNYAVKHSKNVMNNLKLLPRSETQC
jgi:adenosylhomocysteine nucleosidase